MKVDIVKLDNKGRKGMYIRIKEKGYPTRYYKYYTGEEQIERTKRYYYDKYIAKKGMAESYKRVVMPETMKPRSKGLITDKKEKDILSKIRKKKPLNKVLRRGVYGWSISDVLTTSNNEIMKKRKAMMSKISGSKKVGDELAKDENMRKLRKFFDYKFMALDKDNNVLVDGTIHGRLLEEAIKELNEAFKHDKVVAKRKYRFIDRLKRKGWKVRKVDDGTIKSIRLRVNARV